MVRIEGFLSELASSLPATYALLKSAKFTVHPAVSRVTLHGSRGLAGGYRPDSDIDLCLIVDAGSITPSSQLQSVLREVVQTTLGNWTSDIEADLAVVFDVRNCGLRCFEKTAWDDRLCSTGGLDCFGLYKVQKGFDGFVANAGVQVKRMYPCMKIWERSQT